MTDKDGSDERARRRKAALRDNLKRRKQAARRTRDAAGDGKGETPDKTGA